MMLMSICDFYALIMTQKIKQLIYLNILISNCNIKIIKGCIKVDEFYNH